MSDRCQVSIDLILTDYNLLTSFIIQQETRGQASQSIKS